MPKIALATRRPTLSETIEWIAYNDECNPDTSALDMAGMISVCLAADMFGANQYRFASAVILKRQELGLPWREMTPEENREFIQCSREVYEMRGRLS